MRGPHILSHNRGGEYPRDVVVVDTETNEVELPDGSRGHVLAFGWAMYSRRARGDEWTREQWHRFATRGEFWTWLVRRVRARGRLIVYAHNAEFDAMVLDAFGELRRRGWRLVSACLEGPPTIIRWRRGGRTIQFLCTLNLWRVKLAELGKRVGLKKLSMPSRWVGGAAEDRYCRRDVEIVWRSLRSWWAFLKHHDLGTAAATLAGQSLNAFRHRFMRAQVFIDADEGALSLARSAYLGGRCECLQLGRIDSPVVTLDVNSMYPYVMRAMQAPIRLLACRSMATMGDLERYLQSYCVVADVELDTGEPAYPHVIDGRLCFPVGRFRQALCTPELSHAMRRGHVKRVHRVAVYERAPLFSAFVGWAWRTRMSARSAGDSLLDWQVKIMANSLYGKFGQRGRQWEVIAQSNEYAVRNLASFDIDGRRWEHVRQLGSTYQALIDKGESMHSHPAIAAHVTSAARLYLWKLLQRAGMENVYYCDTDSLKGSELIARRLARYIAPERLGGLKVEKREPWLHIHGCKDYEGPESAKRKGVRPDAETSDGVAFAQSQWSGWAGAIARGRLDMPVVSQVVKVLLREYSKGDVLPSGRVRPLTLA